MLDLESLNKRVETLEKLVEKILSLPQIETEFDKLCKLLNSNDWPAAIAPDLICDITSEQDKEDRAEGILDIIIATNLQNLSFLDFGCGDGHVVKRASKANPKVAIGYDIEESPKWKEEAWENSICTNNWETITKNGPFDIILLYDVLDHVDNQEEALVKIKSVCHKNSKVYARCHPFPSRHGTHLYQQLNKAFIHLVFTEEELNSLNVKPMKTQKITTPILHYNKLFQDNGFKLLKPVDVTKEPTESFFATNPLVRSRIKSNNNFKIKESEFPAQLENQFLDYVLQIR